MKDLPKKIAIIGAGPSGLFMAKQLSKIAKKQDRKIEITILEKNMEVGGKCHTFTDPLFPDLRTELGAGAIAPNYGVVIEAMNEYGVAFEYLIETNKGDIKIEKLFKNTPWAKTPKFIAKILQELRQFDEDYKINIGSYVLGAFEDVLCVSNSAINLANQMFVEKPKPVEDETFSQFKNGWNFFRTPAYQPIDDKGFGNPHTKGCVIL